MRRRHPATFRVIQLRRWIPALAGGLEMAGTRRKRRGRSRDDGSRADARIGSESGENMSPEEGAKGARKTVAVRVNPELRRTPTGD